MSYRSISFENYKAAIYSEYGSEEACRHSFQHHSLSKMSHPEADLPAYPLFSRPQPGNNVQNSEGYQTPRPASYEYETQDSRAYSKPNRDRDENRKRMYLLNQSSNSLMLPTEYHDDEGTAIKMDSAPYYWLIESRRAAVKCGYGGIYFHFAAHLFIPRTAAQAFTPWVQTLHVYRSSGGLSLRYDLWIHQVRCHDNGRGEVVQQPTDRIEYRSRDIHRKQFQRYCPQSSVVAPQSKSAFPSRC